MPSCTTLAAFPLGVESYPDHSCRENGDNLKDLSIALNLFTMSRNLPVSLPGTGTGKVILPLGLNPKQLTPNLVAGLK